MKKIVVIGIGFSALLTIVFAGRWLGNDPDISVDASSEFNSHGATQQMPQAIAQTSEHSDHQHGEGMQASPFSLASVSPEAIANNAGLAPRPPQNMAALPENEVVSPAEAARNKKLQELGYMLPPEYYAKDLRTLRKMAKAGDAYAMMHIGEKYYFELQGQEQHPEFEKNMDYAKAAKQSFQDALVAGNIRSAGIIAELYFQEKNSTEAYAWHLISDQLGDSISAEWFRRTEMAMQASDAVKQAAAQRATQILTELKLKKKSG